MSRNDRARVTVEVDGVTTVVGAVRLEGLVLERVRPEEAEVRNGAGEVVRTATGPATNLYVFRVEGVAEPDENGDVARISRTDIRKSSSLPHNGGSSSD